MKTLKKIKKKKIITEPTPDIDRRRKWLSSLSEEKLAVLKEKRRERAKNMTEEQRAAKTEKQRLYRLNMSEEKRKAELEKKRKVPIEKQKAHRAKYLQKMTDEKREEMKRKISDYSKKHRSSWTEERKAAVRERVRLYVKAHRNREERNKKERIKRQSFTEEQRAALRAKWKEQHRKLAERQGRVLKEPMMPMTAEERRAKNNERGKLRRMKAREERLRQDPDKYKKSDTPRNIRRREQARLKREQKLHPTENNDENLPNIMDNDENLNTEISKKKSTRAKRKVLSVNNEEDLNEVQSIPKKTLLIKKASKTKQKASSENKKRDLNTALFKSKKRILHVKNAIETKQTLFYANNVDNLSVTQSKPIKEKKRLLIKKEIKTKRRTSSESGKKELNIAQSKPEKKTSHIKKKHKTLSEYLKKGLNVAKSKSEDKTLPQKKKHKTLSEYINKDLNVEQSQPEKEILSKKKKHKTLADYVKKNLNTSMTKPEKKTLPLKKKNKKLSEYVKELNVAQFEPIKKTSLKKKHRTWSEHLKDLNVAQFRPIKKTLPIRKAREEFSANNQQDSNIEQRKCKKKTLYSDKPPKIKQKASDDNNENQEDVRVVRSKTKLIQMMDCKVVLTRTKIEKRVIGRSAEYSERVLRRSIKSPTKDERNIIKHASTITEIPKSNVFKNIKQHEKRVQWKPIPKNRRFAPEPIEIIDDEPPVGKIRCVPLSILLEKPPQPNTRANNRRSNQLFLDNEEDPELPLDFMSDPIELDPLLEADFAIEPDDLIVTHIYLKDTDM